MPLDPVNDRRPPITPQLAIRVAIIGGAALVMFGVIFFRLWYLQVLSGDRYLAEANNNRVREINVEAPRGKIVDRNGRLLVGNRTGYAVQITPDKFSLGLMARALVAAQGGKMDLAREYFGRLSELQPGWREDAQSEARKVFPADAVANRLVRDLARLSGGLGQ